MMGTAADSIHIVGRILFLTCDETRLDRQLGGEDMAYDPSLPLMSNISTDELTPAWACYYYDETLARYCLVGLRGGKIGKDAIRNGGFCVLVSGASKGCGSSRETAPYSELQAGIKAVIAKSFEKIYRQNAQNIGLFTSTDFGLIERIRNGEPIPISEFTQGLDPISTAIVERGGLFAYNRARLAGKTSPPAVNTAARAMTLCEKILAAHLVMNANENVNTGTLGTVAVKPNDAFFARTDVRFSHEYTTAMAESLFVAEMGKGARVTDPESVWAFRDHLTFVDSIMTKSHRDMGLGEQAQKLASVQEDFAKRQNIKLYGEVFRESRARHDLERLGSEAICHNKVIEDIALPGQLVIGTDSHTCMAGSLGCFAFGVGATDMANAWYTKDVRVTVPHTVKIVLEGTLAPWASAKDVMLFLLSQEFFKRGEGIGKVLEFVGPGVRGLSLDERATLTNMAVEAGGFSGIIEADDAVVDYLVAQRGLDAEVVRARIVRADDGAVYYAIFTIDLGTIEPMIATPGDPRNGMTVSHLVAISGAEGVRIDRAYGCSFTGVKKTDMDMYAAVLKGAVAKGNKVKAGVRLYIQFGSQDIRRYAESKGYIDIFRVAGAELLNPSCGACVNAGPGVSGSPEQVTISAINRNFPGRSGPGKVYLASPLVVAASEKAGKIVRPDEEQ
jgi:3-isopropylmalate/(R)-2-methylmalate dehydratase large subunit